MVSFQEKPQPNEARSNLASTGIYFFEPEAIDLIPSGEVFDIGSQLFPMLVEKRLPFYAQNASITGLILGEFQIIGKCCNAYCAVRLALWICQVRKLSLVCGWA